MATPIVTSQLVKNNVTYLFVEEDHELLNSAMVILQGAGYEMYLQFQHSKSMDPELSTPTHSLDLLGVIRHVRTNCTKETPIVLLAA